MNILRFFVLIFGLLSWSCTRNVHVQVMKPAPVTVGQHIKTLAIINRTVPENKAINLIEGIFTGETPGQDKQGAFEVLGGLNQALSNSPRFASILTNIKLTGSGSGGVLPEPMSWDAIASICQENAADAIISLETYDSDFIITNATKLVDKKREDGTAYKQTIYTAKGVATVKFGFRLYDPQNKSIVDHFTFTHAMEWSTSGTNVIEAASKLIGRNNAINAVSSEGGRMYVRRISPSWYTVTREFYKKAGKAPEMKIGRRRADVNDWAGAEELWTKVANTKFGKTAGKAAYNTAVAREVQGDLEGAKFWAQKAYTDFGIKKSVDYINLINRRIWEEQRLNEQLGRD
jgi:hypothetical protein